MKKRYYLHILALSFSSFAQVGISTSTPNAQLDIRSSDQVTPSKTDGLLIPKVDKLVDAAIMTSNQQGMMVYLTTTFNGKSPGFYYWDSLTLTWIGFNTNAVTNSDVINIEDFLFDEYAGGASSGTGKKNDNQYSFTPLTNNGGSSNIEGETTSNSYIGIHQLTTGTNNNNDGRAGIGSSDWFNKFRLGAYEYFLEFRVRFPVLAISGVDYNAYMGFTDISPATITTINSSIVTSVSNGVYFTYNSTGLFGTCENSNQTSTTTKKQIVAGTWYKIKMLINASGTSVDFFVDGVKLGSTITTKIPANTTPMKIVGLLEKISTTATSSTADIDYVTWKMVR